MIELTIEGPVARLMVNRPEKLNALTAGMCDALIVRCRQIERSGVRLVILSGAGKAFCVGGDIDAWSGETAEAFGDHWVRDGHLAFDALARLTVPMIAVLDGHVLGGGLELAACADLRIAEEHIRIGQPETGLGIIPGWSGTQRAVRRFGAQIIRRMALMGEVFDASEALAHGLVDEVVSRGAAPARADEVVARVLGRSVHATKLTKMLINAAEGEERERVLEALAGRIAADTDDLPEGLAAFRDKRPPNF
ncbi:MAG: enoyl-CoA hydratase/isomerase family protein [Rhodobacteraceae bacterium]|nr:enoyl-CoA hydratase/isomerase family protein [Paracoccaceae bacterium]